MVAQLALRDVGRAENAPGRALPGPMLRAHQQTTRQQIQASRDSGAHELFGAHAGQWSIETTESLPPGMRRLGESCGTGIPAGRVRTAQQEQWLLEKRRSQRRVAMDRWSIVISDVSEGSVR